jgi:ABC-2 type transport system permease protein
LILTAYILGRVDVPAIGPVGAFSLGLGVPSSGSPALAFVVALLLAIGAVNLGIFLSTFARTELQIVQFIPIVIVPQGLLGGVFWPIDRLPAILQAIAHVMPVTYAVDALREVMLKGSDLGAVAVQTDLLVLAAIALVFVVLGALTIKREVA